jgi:hypothetical protein
VIDSKYPMRNSANLDFKCNKIILLVRDPFEVIMNNYHMTTNFTHT